MSLMNIVYRPYLEKFIMMFVDDILYFDNEKEHANYLWIALQVLRDNRLFTMFSKYDFWLKDVNFLGHNF